MHHYFDKDLSFKIKIEIKIVWKKTIAYPSLKVLSIYLSSWNKMYFNRWIMNYLTLFHLNLISSIKILYHTQYLSYQFIISSVTYNIKKFSLRMTRTNNTVFKFLKPFIRISFDSFTFCAEWFSFYA